MDRPFWPVRPSTAFLPRPPGGETFQLGESGQFVQFSPVYLQPSEVHHDGGVSHRVARGALFRNIWLRGLL
jgi:hypothetical protein